MLLLKKLAQAQRCKQEDIAIILNTQQSEVSKMMNGLRQITEEHIELLIAHFGRDVVESFIVDDEVVDIFSTPQARQVEASIIPAEAVEEARVEVIEEAQAPIIPRQIANAGSINIKKYIEENASELEYFNPLSITGDGLVVGIVRTAEMSPTLMPHDRVFINFLKDKMHITDGDVYFWVTKSHPAMFRIAKKESNGYFRLIAENPRYGDIIIHSSEIINIGTTDGGLFRQKIVCQTEIEEVRRKKDEQIDKLIAQNGEALQIIGAMIKKNQ